MIQLRVSFPNHNELPHLPDEQLHVEGQEELMDNNGGMDNSERAVGNSYVLSTNVRVADCPRVGFSIGPLLSITPLLSILNVTKKIVNVTKNIKCH